MKKYISVIFTTILIHNLIIAHCQVPCGIYDDAMRIIQINEDFNTIKKAMNKINELSINLDSVSLNQLNRWVNTKEDHASEIQNIISNYFLTQRIKETSPQYNEQITTLQRLLVITMKCKQTVDTNNVRLGIKLIESFNNIYFDSHGLEHLDKISN